MGRRQPDENLTIRVDPDVLLWARMRALMRGTSVNQLIRRCLETYAQVPEAWWQGLPPPWSDLPPNQFPPEPESILAPEDR